MSWLDSFSKTRLERKRRTPHGTVGVHAHGEIALWWQTTQHGTQETFMEGIAVCVGVLVGIITVGVREGVMVTVGAKRIRKMSLL